jgi:hypothetical protein
MLQRSFGIHLLAPYVLVSFRCGLDPTCLLAEIAASCNSSTQAQSAGRVVGEVAMVQPTAMYGRDCDAVVASAGGRPRVGMARDVAFCVIGGVARREPQKLRPGNYAQDGGPATVNNDSPLGNRMILRSGSDSQKETIPGTRIAKQGCSPVVCGGRELMKWRSYNSDTGSTVHRWIRNSAYFL